MEKSENEGEDSSLVKWGGQKGSEWKDREKWGDPDTQRRKDKITN